MPASTETCFQSRIWRSLVPGQRQTQRVGQGLDFRGQSVADLLGLVAIGQVQQHRVAGLPFDESADRSLVLLADDQVPLPVPWHCPVLDLSRPLRDIDHVRDAVLALPDLAARTPQRPPGAQTHRQITAQSAARLHVDRLVDGLW